MSVREQPASPDYNDTSIYLTEERLRLRNEAREFAMQEVLPVANECDPKKEDIPEDLMKKIADKGYFGITIPEEYGGMGLGVFEYCLITEELARAWMSVASIIARGNGLTVQKYLSDEKRCDYLARMARGAFIGAFALSEPQTGSDAANISTRAVRDGDGWVINGEKRWCGVAKRADFIILFARTSEPPDPMRRHRGISCFVFEKERNAFPPGITASPIDKIGYHGLTSWNLKFEDFRIPGDSLVGEEGRGFAIAMSGLEVARAHTAARAVGLARGGVEDAIEYAQRRVQFGQPIAKFQAIRFKIAEMAAEIEAARQLTYHVAHEIDTGRRCSKEASMAKLFASEMSERVTSETLQIFGGNGYTTEHAVERYWRDARLTKIFEGTSEIQKRIISDQLLGR
jgi:alkylation response protein AidB-like acyl-CoA dehydrogenase